MTGRRSWRRRRRPTAPGWGPGEADAAFLKILAGHPACACGHGRAKHIGRTAYGAGFTEGPCQVDGCVCTAAGYVPGDGTPWTPLH